MKTKNTLQAGEARQGEMECDAAASVDDFIRELEEKEKDLHITAELVIEVEKSEIDDKNLPDFVAAELAAAAPKPVESAPRTPEKSSFHLKSEITELENTISKFKAERSEILERSRRQSADFENFKRRMERDRHDTLSAQMMNLANTMLPVLDNLNRALEFVSSISEEKRNELEQFFEGIVLVSHQVNDVLAEMGVQPIAAVGAEFDPNFHEAVAIVESPHLPPNTVAEELLRGYRMGGRVIRHSMVKVTMPRPWAAERESE